MSLQSQHTLEEKMREHISVMLRQLRKKQKLSQQNLAQMVQTTQAVISRIENKNVSPSLELLHRIAEACDKKLEIFFS
jgi:transcriptional regulator with XRE-family HTH domain